MDGSFIFYFQRGKEIGLLSMLFKIKVSCPTRLGLQKCGNVRKILYCVNNLLPKGNCHCEGPHPKVIVLGKYQTRHRRAFSNRRLHLASKLCLPAFN